MSHTRRVTVGQSLAFLTVCEWQQQCCLHRSAVRSTRGSAREARTQRGIRHTEGAHSNSRGGC